MGLTARPFDGLTGWLTLEAAKPPSMFHNMKNMRLLATTALIALAGCGDGTGPDPNPPIITLSAQQATTLLARAEVMAAAHPDLAWLSDSLEVVVRAGAQAKRITVRENGEPVDVYAVSLQRHVLTGTTSFATWHLFSFDDASNPTFFFVANGFAQSSGPTPPSSVNGAFGGQSVFAHLVIIDGNVTDPRRATTGGATFSLSSLGSACPVSGTPPANITCNMAEMQVGFDIVNLTPPFTVARTYNLLAVAVPGVLLTIEE